MTATRIGHRTSAPLVPQRSFFVFSVLFFPKLITSVYPFPHPNASLLRGKSLDFAHYYIFALKAGYQFFYLFFQWKLTFWRSYCIYQFLQSTVAEQTVRTAKFDKRARKTWGIFSYSVQTNQMMMKYSHATTIATFSQSSAAIWCNHSARHRWSILRTWSNFACHSGAGGRQHPSTSFYFYLFIYIP